MAPKWLVEHGAGGGGRPVATRLLLAGSLSQSSSLWCTGTARAREYTCVQLCGQPTPGAGDKFCGSHREQVCFFLMCGEGGNDINDRSERGGG